MSSKFQASLRERAEAEERPRLAAAARLALAKEPSAAALVELSASASVLGKLSAADAKLALAHVKFGLAQTGTLLWEGVHLACEIEVPDPAIDDLVDALEDLVANTRLPGPTRARALEGFADMSGISAADKFFEEIVKSDESWTVRRAAKDSSRRIAKDDSLRGRLFGRYEALIRCERIRTEVSEEIVDGEQLGKSGLQLPPTLLSFFLEQFVGGRLIHLELNAKGEPVDAGHLALRSPGSYVHAAGADTYVHPSERNQRRQPDLANFDEYVYTRYIDGDSSYPKVDEDYALTRYTEHYSSAVLDEESYNYGVLCFERAYVDEANRASHLLRARDVLRTFRDRNGEEWEEIDDRHDEAAETITTEGLAWPLRDAPGIPIQIGTYSGVFELAIDLEGQGVFARDPQIGEWWRIATCLSAFLNQLSLPNPGEVPVETPLELLELCRTQIEAGQRRKAARTLADALEQDRKSTPVLEAAGALLGALEPLEAAQLLSSIVLAGDRTSSDSAKAALQAIDPDHGLAMIEAIVPYDEDGTQIALLVDCAAALRKKSHAEVRKLAKDSRDTRSKRQIRTLRNPFYS
ncbi:MAG: hypothetical protein JKY65_03000 [Planctomycetes bacterium]|nr:hypothetical protein [Planctomycetota bacterium]